MKRNGGLVSRNRLVVVKFGSSVLQGEHDLPTVVKEIAHWSKQEPKVLSVVSAFGEVTETLLRRAYAYVTTHSADGPDREAVARLVATGEETSAALLVLALLGAGIRAKLLGAEQIGLFAEGAPLDAKLSNVDTERIWSAFSESSVVVVPGFIARNAEGATVLLGRGGSDLTAVFLAHRMRANRCRLIKDVDGLYASDPKSGCGLRPEKHRHLSWGEALGLKGKVVQKKALEFAAANQVTFEVGGLGAGEGTVVGVPV
jgi:homoserine dehydrogenase